MLRYDDKNKSDEQIRTGSSSEKEKVKQDRVRPEGGMTSKGSNLSTMGGLGKILLTKRGHPVKREE